MSLTSRHAIVRPATAQLNELLGKDSGARTSQAYELTRVMDTLKVKEKVIEEQMREISTLKSNLAKAQRDLVNKQSQMENAEEKAAQALGGATASSKELAALRLDKKKLEGQVADLMRQTAKLKDQLTQANAKNPGVSQQLVALQGSVRAARSAAEAAEAELKGVTNQLRNKDKELARMTKLVEDANAVVARNGELENRVRELNKQLDVGREEARKMEATTRQRDADIAKLNKDMMGMKETLSASNAAHADTTAQLKAMTARCNEQELEMNRMRDELARTGAVAARVAAAEVRAGSKDEGTVHITQHLEEMKYWQGETNRLKDKVASLEKQLQVSHELKSRYRATAERRGSTAGDSRSPSPSASSRGGGDRDRTTPSGTRGRDVQKTPTGGRMGSALKQPLASFSILDDSLPVEDAAPKPLPSASPMLGDSSRPPVTSRVTRSGAKGGAGGVGASQEVRKSTVRTRKGAQAGADINDNDTAQEVDVDTK